MRPRPDGDFDVEPKEEITFKVIRKNTPNKATIDPRQGWVSPGSEQVPDDRTKTRTCEAPPGKGAVCKAEIGVNFRKDEQGKYDPDDEYSIQVSGSAGGSVTDSIAPPPVMNSQPYIFHVKPSEKKP